MKKLLPLFLLLAFVSTSCAWPWDKKPTPSKPAAVAAAKPSPTPKPTIQGGRDIVKEIAAELTAAKAENAKLKDSVASLGNKLALAQQQIGDVQKQADALKEWGNIQQAEAQKFMEKYNAAVKRYHRLKLIAAIIGAAAGVLLGMQFMNFAPPPYNFLVPVGSAALFASLVWFFL